MLYQTWLTFSRRRHAVSAVLLVLLLASCAHDAKRTPTADPRPTTPVEATTEPKPDPKPVETPEPKPDPKPVETPEPKPDPRPVETPEPKPDPKPVETPEPKPDPKPVETPEPKPDPKPVETPEPKPDPKPVETPEPKPDPKPVETPEPKTDPKPVETPEPKTDPKPVEKPKPDPKPVVKPDPKPVEKPKPKVVPDPKPVVKAEPKPSPGAVVRGEVVFTGRSRRKLDTAEEAVGIVIYDHESTIPSETVQGDYSIVTKDKTFNPVLLLVPRGATVQFPNMDPIIHNVFSVSKGNKFDAGRYSKAEGARYTFMNEGLVRVYCNVHHSMNAMIYVAANPHFTYADEDGNFELKGLSDGTYTLAAIHKLSGLTKTELVVRDGRAEPVTLELKVRSLRLKPHLNKEGKPYEKRKGERY